MSKVSGKEEFPLMDKPTAPPAVELGFRIPQTSDPGFDPPPYSSVIGSQSQGYTALPSASANPPYPVVQPPPQQQAPYPSDNVYNPTMSVPQMYNPMASGVPTLTPRRITNVRKSWSGNSRWKRRCFDITVLSVVGFIVIAFCTGIGIWHRSQVRKQARENAELKRLQEESEKSRIVDPWASYDWDALQEKVNSVLHNHGNYGNRYKRSYGDPFKNYKDFDFERLNEATLALVNTLEKSGKLVHEQPRYPGSKNNHFLFKRNIREKIFRTGSKIVVT